MYRLKVRGLAPLVLAACTLAFAPLANAQCADPDDVPAELLGSIFEEAGIGFGELDENVCNKIAKKGVSTCRSLVKSAAKCLNQVADTHNSITATQCNELDNPERGQCKNEAKDNRDAARAEAENLQNANLTVCETEFNEDLLGLCLLGPL
jgi:hypothetical protein